MTVPAHDRALYSISVTSELTGVNPQMLRVYERKGLLAPYRTEGGTRRYSGEDVDTIAGITTLLAAGLNLAGVGHVLQLRSETRRLQGELDRIRAEGAPASLGSDGPNGPDGDKLSLALPEKARRSRRAPGTARGAGPG